MSFEIPDDFIKSTALLTHTVSFEVATTADSSNVYGATTENKTITIRKINNGLPEIVLDVDGTTLTSVLKTEDPDGAGSISSYQWQTQAHQFTAMDRCRDWNND